MTDYSPNVIMTYTKRLVDPTNLTIWDIDYRDVAHALAATNRYNGHTAMPCSVAEHSCRVHDWLGWKGYSAETCLRGLWHDAAEAYIGDVAAPLKRNLPGYKELQHKVENVVNRYMAGLYARKTSQGPDLEAVDYVDKRMCIYEALAGWPDGELHPIWEAKFGRPDPKEAGILTPEFWAPMHAKGEFLRRLNRYIRVRY